MGSAEVVYTGRSDASAALKQYNNVLLDGKPMKIEVVGTNAEVPISARIQNYLWLRLRSSKSEKVFLNTETFRLENG
ncbi:hypothetical protein ACOSQ2_010423 [Xanthoceras sorbifolium]